MDRIGHMLHLDLHGLAGSGHQHLYAGIHPVGLADLLLQRVGATLLGDQRGKRPRSIKLGVHQRDHGLGSEHRQQGHIIRVPLDQFVPKQALCVRWRNNDVYRADLSYGAWIKVTVRLIVQRDAICTIFPDNETRFPLAPGRTDQRPGRRSQRHVPHVDLFLTSPIQLGDVCKANRPRQRGSRRASHDGHVRAPLKKRLERRLVTVIVNAHRQQNHIRLLCHRVQVNRRILSVDPLLTLVDKVESTERQAPDQPGVDKQAGVCLIQADLPRVSFVACVREGLGTSHGGGRPAIHGPRAAHACAVPRAWHLVWNGSTHRQHCSSGSRCVK
mmetsp:Transcript_5214/g.14929  ORF Transcript_5214/g.14929 Transcript_5214/m.14929 type:complete len:329 (-) Transcript_5214:67-1053(-)